MKNQNYIKTFTTEDEAMDWMGVKNRSCKLAGNVRDFFCVVDGAENNFAVVDISTAIELGGGYKWEAQ